jgi:hypothetical protein
VGGLDTWPSTSDLDEITEPRLTRKLEFLTGVSTPRLFAPPRDSTDPREPIRGIGVWRFPEFFVVQEAGGDGDRRRSRRLVHRKALDDRGRFEGQQVVATRFVRACPRGHVDDLDWRGYIHGGGDCRRQLWLDERGTTGDLAELFARCECGKQRSMSEATLFEAIPLGVCPGSRPWLGRNSNEDCNLPSRLLIRTASHAYFAQVLSALSLPERAAAVDRIVRELWDDLQIVDDASALDVLKRKPRVAQKVAGHSDEEVLEAIQRLKGGAAVERPVKQVELEAILSVPEGFGDDVPIDENFHARRLPDHVWRRSDRSAGIEAVIQLHRLREVLALLGFTRFEAVTPDVNGEYETDVQRAQIALEPSWFPAIENRGEGVFVQLGAAPIRSWLERPAVKSRLKDLLVGHVRWAKDHKSPRRFPEGPYLLLHTLSHLLVQSLSMRSGYPLSSIRERVFVDDASDRFGLLLYTGSPDAEGTLGGLVQQARHIEDHLAHAIRLSALCSNDPICAQHAPGESLEERWLHGAACHGCAFVPETSCEMHNDYLDRALVVPVLGVPDAAFFGAIP